MKKRREHIVKPSGFAEKKLGRSLHQATAVQRRPHPVYALTWAVWSIGLVVAAVLANVWVTGGLWLAFAIAEGIAVFRESDGMRDTLSEIVTYYQRKNSKHRKIIIGFNAVITVYVLVIAYTLLSWILALGVPLWFAWVPPAGLVLYLIPHWFSPDVHG